MKMEEMSVSIETIDLMISITTVFNWNSSIDSQWRYRVYIMGLITQNILTQAKIIVPIPDPHTAIPVAIALFESK